jgi:X-Pro dipeptidyl-peptidase
MWLRIVERITKRVSGRNRSLARNCAWAVLVFGLPSSLLSEEPAKPVFQDGQAQKVVAFSDPDLWVRHDLWVETTFDSDGDGAPDRIHVGVTRPRQTESEGLKLPVIFLCSPYFGGTATNGDDLLWDVRHELGEAPPPHKSSPKFERRGVRPIISESHVREWVPRGFAVVHASSPGTGLSQGCPTIGADNESLAPKAVIDWLNGRATGYSSIDGDEQVEAYWSTGKVGMTGTSHLATLALAAATTGVDGLEAIVPIAPNTSPYHYYRSNGLVRHPFRFMGEDIDSLYDYVHSGNGERRDYCNSTVRDEEMLAQFDRVNGDYNMFWEERDYLKDLEPVRAAVLMCHAFNDWNVVPEHSVRIFEALKRNGVQTQAFFHQGGHGGGPPMKLINQWFSHYLHGVENDVEKGPRAWIVREDDERGNPTPYDDYPNPEAGAVALFPVAGAPERGSLALEQSAEQPTERLVDNFSFDGAALARAEWTEHRLIYVTPALAKPVHLSGTPRISIRLASSRPTANLSVWLVSLPWSEDREAKITDNVITRGWADPQNHRSLRESEPLRPGRFYDLTFELQPDDQIIAAGQQIGLMVFSSDHDFTLRPTPGTELTIDLNATSLTLPVVGGVNELREAFVSSDPPAQ